MGIYNKIPKNTLTNSPKVMRIVFGKDELIFSISLTRRGLFKLYVLKNSTITKEQSNPKKVLRLQ